MNSATSSSGDEHMYPFTNNITLDKLQQQSGYMKVMEFCKTHHISGIKEAIAFVEKIDENQINDVMQSIGIEPDELRLLKQAVNNNICLAVFETFKQKTETLRKDGSKLAVPGINMRGGIDQVSIGDIKRIYGNQKAMKYLFLTGLIGGKYKNRTLSILSSVGEIIYIQSQLIRARVTTISKNRYDFPIEFYTTFFIKAWHILFQELLTVYFSETMNQEISTLYWFLEKILIKDLAYKNNGQTFTSDIYMLIPNTNLSQMAAFIRSKKGALSIQEIELFLKKQTHKNIKDSLDKDGRLLSGPNSARKIIKDGVAHVAEPMEELMPLPTFGGCPFAKIKTSEGKNAFIDMYCIFNEWYVSILKGLADNKLIYLKDYPTSTPHSS